MFEVYISQAVLTEVGRGDPVEAAERLDTVKDVPLIHISSNANELAKALVVAGALPTKARVDAPHLATATTNGIRFLLPWNCRHLANAAMRQKIEQVCLDAGHTPPAICTPNELGGFH